MFCMFVWKDGREWNGMYSCMFKCVRTASIVVGVVLTERNDTTSACIECNVDYRTVLVSYYTILLYTFQYTGSLFQLVEGNPPAGMAGTAAIMAIGFPACGYLFYASILKGTAETEQDDKEYLSTRRGR
jgi:hypothetical protein